MKKLAGLMDRKRQIKEQEKRQADFNAGTICSVLANIHRDEKKKKKPYQPEDFMPKEKEEKEEKQKWENQLKMIEMLNAAMGGRDSRGGANNGR